jgi:addiction module HigA family antidote
MAVKQEDYEAGRVDLSDVLAPGDERIPLSHPGLILKEQVVEPLGLNAHRLAKGLKVPPNRVTAILAGKRAITADTSIRLGRFFGMSPDYWHRMQGAYDLDRTLAEAGAKITEEVAAFAE